PPPAALDPSGRLRGRRSSARLASGAGWYPRVAGGTPLTAVRVRAPERADRRTMHVDHLDDRGVALVASGKRRRNTFTSYRARAAITPAEAQSTTGVVGEFHISHSGVVLAPYVTKPPGGDGLLREHRSTVDSWFHASRCTFPSL